MPSSKAATRNHTTGEIWSLTLEIINLLTGETCDDAQPGDLITITVTPPLSLTPDTPTLQKILEVTRKITELLIVEMKSPLELCLEAKVENEVEPATKEVGTGRDLWPEVKMEPSEVKLWEYRDGSAAGETGVSSEESCKEEASSSMIGSDPEDAPISNEKKEEKKVLMKIKEEDPLLEISPDGNYSSNKTEGHPTILSHDAESTGTTTTQPPHPVLAPSNLSSLPSTHSILRTGFPPPKLPYYCSICGKQCAQKSHLINHEKVHKREKSVLCSQCGKSFTCKSALLTHERVHTGEKPYSCSICGKCFARKLQMITHERVHTGEKPYICYECGKSFSDKSYFNRHTRVHMR